MNHNSIEIGKSKPFTVKLVTVCIALLMFSGISYAQALDPGQDPDVPVDGGLSILVAAGAAYGAKKIRQKRLQK